MEWNVYRVDVNQRKIDVFNIFDHWTFTEYCAKAAAKKDITKKEFAECDHKLTLRFFGYKFEWEIWINYIFDDKDEYTKKVDVRHQVMFNFDVFVNYVWDNRGELIKLNKKRKKRLKK